ncbi:chromosome segregation protein SMC [Asaia sp. W19]|uniref:AAA family ATPase n=1 Tax=unclassified Asaia TaxID=2685023 RepID=UPI000F8F0748|nr:AAA family ATPase [Asaia sp. W19]RUT24533.1 chromosome segregation protein SMC [Asaia sp. W19]
MSAKITRLRIAGFKSFADPATIDILPGLTGIVGPNGCGKSNVVEALRWAMGESSARALRGGELDDLIFAGTSARSARSLAEVTLWLEEATGLAPPPFSETDGLEICRRAERGSGSDFRLNGRALRARDITTMFADLSSGARSSSIVSQNRVSALISAKPEERRSLLEEAAGISGLHARRHDAELKLRQAEGNIARSEDLRQQITNRLEQLDAQSTQARAYRSLSESIREDESALSWLVHRRAALLVERTEGLLQEAERQRDDAGQGADMAEQATIAHKMRVQALRETVESVREARDKLRLTAETSRESLTQSRAACEQAMTRQAQNSADRSLAQARLDEALARQDALKESLDRLDITLRTLPDTLTVQEKAAEQAELALRQAESQVASLTASLTRDRLAAQALAKDHETTAQRIQSLECDEARLTEALANVRAQMPDEAALHALQKALDEKRRTRQDHDARVEGLNGQCQDARLSLADAEQKAGQARREAEQARLSLEALHTRQKALLAQIAAHETELAALDEARLGDEALSQEDARAITMGEARDAARQQADAHQAAHAEAQQALAAIEAQIAGAARQRELLTKEHDQANQACARHDAQIQGFAAQRDHLVAEMPDDALLAGARQQRKDVEASLVTLNAERETLSTERNIVRQDWERAHKASQTATAHMMALRVQYEALRATRGETSLPDPLIEALVIPAGLERALAVALDQTIEASLDATQSRAWLLLPEQASQPLPPGSTPLSALIRAPEALARCFSAIALIDDPTMGKVLQPSLLPGQCLVSRDGGLWRWDGYCDTGSLPSRALGPVETVARLRALEEEIRASETALPPLQAQTSTLEAREQTIVARLEALREALHRDEALLPKLRREEDALSSRADRVTSQLAQLEQRREEAMIQREEMGRRADAAREALAELPSEASMQGQHAQRQHAADAEKFLLTQAQGNLRDADTAYAEARERATRCRLQEEARAAKATTLTGVLAQEKRDQQDIAAHCAQLEAQDHETALRITQEMLRSNRATLTRVEEELTAARGAGEALGRDIGAASRDLQTARDLKLSLTSRLSALLPQHEALVSNLTEMRAHQTTLAPVPDLTPRERELDQCREREATSRQNDLTCREALRETKAALEKALQEKEQTISRRVETLSTIAALEEDLQRLAERVAEGEKEIARASAEASRLETVTLETAEALSRAESDFASAAEALAEIDSAIEALSRTRRDEEQRCATARENAIRLQERLEQARAQYAKLDEGRANTPEETFDLPLTEQSETSLKRRLARNQKEREALGPVNLLAEQEYAEAHSQSEHLAREHDELESAINRLRGSINALKKEGRERLQAVFVEVDRHFQALFSRMFNGGKAHLGLVGSDDPLEAGLEIFAQPPGKKLSTLSLLSGGEQALTALSLIFATFKCQPSPLCILDEVDAPLDDANVERLCSLLKDMAEEAQTRFLVVTHHQLTMAHMDRLFGVTMQERGVSQVLSVDLSLAASFAENGSLAVAP